MTQRHRLKDGSEIFCAEHHDEHHVIHTRDGVLYSSANPQDALHASVTYFHQYEVRLDEEKTLEGMDKNLELLISATAAKPKCANAPKDSCLQVLTKNPRKGWNDYPQAKMCPACALHWALCVARNHLLTCQRMEQMARVAGR